ncbi:hypothetical protein G7Z17_g7059 [Cylindrodendrum hubeiense]|uniref:Methyltransferase n=1 Tax=Cylindrodendrum hubeiense TaxID=595255 RepID=A0A9P5HDY6_9HYPO|nr:hypothetical protein G7Z17_g7059 [Cylindrodendrum hubeiense]
MTDQRVGSKSPAQATSPDGGAGSPPNDLIPGENEDVRDDGDSSLGTDAESSTASMSASILEYRQIQGRTFHSDRFTVDYAFPNDQKQLESVDITHHYLTLLFGNRLFLAPIADDVQQVLDAGTGSGIWAIDFADQYPGAEVIGTDLSPCQPKWVPPNVRFEIDDVTESWTWDDGKFDFIHLRYLFGAIKDWTALYKEAFRCCAPGGWVESAEANIQFRSDDGTADLAPVLDLCTRLYDEGGQAIGRPFFMDHLQPKGFKEAGFTDIKTMDYKVPIGGWAKDPNLAEVGRFVRLTLENDIEGYTLALWNHVLGWPKDEYQIFLMDIRKALRNREIHSYFTVRVVYGRKPE